MDQRKDYELLEDERDSLRLIKAEHDFIDINTESETVGYTIEEETHQSKLPKDEFEAYKKFGMFVDAYLSEMINHICYKLQRIQELSEVEYPKDVNLLIEAFNTQYEKTIIDKIMIVNEMGRKLYVTSTPIFSNTSKIDSKKSIFHHKNNLRIPNQTKSKMKRAVTKADRNFGKIVTTSHSATPPDNSVNYKKHEDSKGVLNYVINKVNKNKKQKGEGHKDISAVLDSNIDKIIDKKFESPLYSKDPRQQQKFFIINAVLKYFYIAYQKRIEYKIMFSYLSTVINMLYQSINEVGSTQRSNRNDSIMDNFSFIVKSKVSEIWKKKGKSVN